MFNMANVWFGKGFCLVFTNTEVYLFEALAFQLCL